MNPLIEVSKISSEIGDQLVRWSARVVVVLYLLRCWIDSGLVPFRNPKDFRESARVIWTIGAILFAIHVGFALSLIHDFSHAKAYEHTAARTAAVTGIDWGGGIFVNYMFLLYWFTDVLLWWRKGIDWSYRSTGSYWIMQAIFAFMFINATVIFGPSHWIWVTVGLVIVILMLRVFQKSR